MANADIRDKMKWASMSQRCDFIIRVIKRERENNPTDEKPKLIPNIALSKYNQYLGLDYDSEEARELTDLVNLAIINTFYQDKVQYEKPTSEFLYNSENGNKSIR